MEYEKYYNKRANGYVVHFPNNKGLSLQEITQIFSAFGKIVSVNNRGKSNGLCFVKYETVEDAKKCIDGLRNNSSIKILPHKMKNNIIDINTNIEASKNVDADAQDKKMFKQNIYKNNSEESNHFSTYLSSTRQFQNTQTDNQSNCNLSESSSKDNFNDDVDVDGKSKTNHHSPIPILSFEQRIRLRNLKKFASNTSISSVVTNNTSRELEDVPDETNIPALVHIDQKCGTRNINITPSVRIVSAYEVIVANIHSSLTIHYMLHLFEKFNPISISLMMRLPKTNILYCHVYFKTYEDAYATMKQFDMHNVYGKKLIVLTSSKLMEEISRL
ncbi:hypothetical protein QLX08_011614 [Tetragonisca angustula]|uniref:RRM domain-containing protein n=1 Tax=Tetragonisca angustula TaxID=166442 RepID=A0AAW0Z7N3_9HYME